MPTLLVYPAPGYRTNLLVALMGHQISWIRSTVGLFCTLVWNLTHFPQKFESFSDIHSSVSGALNFLLVFFVIVKIVVIFSLK